VTGVKETKAALLDFLKEKPRDVVARLALADLLEEEGRDMLAQAHRWAVSACPTYCMMDGEWKPYWILGSLSDQAVVGPQLQDKEREKASVPFLLFPHVGKRFWMTYDNTEEAYQALYEVLLRATEE
jgi:uncharacterized protein (TIGR02996 family)